MSSFSDSLDLTISSQKVEIQFFDNETQFARFDQVTRRTKLNWENHSLRNAEKKVIRNHCYFVVKKKYLNRGRVELMNEIVMSLRVKRARKLLQSFSRTTERRVSGRRRKINDILTTQQFPLTDLSIPSRLKQSSEHQRRDCDKIINFIKSDFLSCLVLFLSIIYIFFLYLSFLSQANISIKRPSNSHKSLIPREA